MSFQAPPVASIETFRFTVLVSDGINDAVSIPVEVVIPKIPLIGGIVAGDQTVALAAGSES